MAPKKVADKKKNLMKNRLVSKKLKNGKPSKKSKNGKKKKTMKTKKKRKEMSGGVFISFLTNKNDDLKGKQDEILKGIINENKNDEKIKVNDTRLGSKYTIQELYNKMMERKNRRFKDAVFRKILIEVTENNNIKLSDNLKILITAYQTQKAIPEADEPDATEDEAQANQGAAQQVPQVDKVVCICFDASKYKNILIDADKQEQVMKILTKNKIPVAPPAAVTNVDASTVANTGAKPVADAGTNPVAGTITDPAAKGVITEEQFKKQYDKVIKEITSKFPEKSKNIIPKLGGLIKDNLTPENIDEAIKIANDLQPPLSQESLTFFNSLTSSIRPVATGSMGNQTEEGAAAEGVQTLAAADKVATGDVAAKAEAEAEAEAKAAADKEAEAEAKKKEAERLAAEKAAADKAAAEEAKRKEAERLAAAAEEAKRKEAAAQAAADKAAQAVQAAAVKKQQQPPIGPPAGGVEAAAMTSEEGAAAMPSLII